MTNITDSFEYQSEEAKVNFQNSINGLLEAHADFLHKISHAVGAKKTGVWVEMSEAEIIAQHIFETVSNLMASYLIINNTNKLLNVRVKALEEHHKTGIRKTLSDFVKGSITKDQFTGALNNFINIAKPTAA